MTAIQWCDAELQNIKIDYDVVELLIHESTGMPHLLRFEGYIGFSYTGAWDELVIAGASSYRDHPFLDECLESISARFNKNPPSTGSTARNQATWKTTEVVFIDDSKLIVAYSDCSDI